jgi:pyrrolysyl-tRNA synthetase-like protein
MEGGEIRRDQLHLMPAASTDGLSTGEVRYSPSQRQRLDELRLGGSSPEPVFASVEERNEAFRQSEHLLIAENRRVLDGLRAGPRRPLLRRVEQMLVETLVDAGFVEVVTPTMIGKGSLEKLGLGPDHPLWRQIYWVDRTRCLRPMLAPNLYFVLGHLQRLWPRPTRLFEVGPCFRKESKGAEHLSEFTMLNLVELAPETPPVERLAELAGLVMDKTGLRYELRATDSEVYGAALDVEVGGLEVASGVAGPHPLDAEWEITEPWAGWGFGLERLTMASAGSEQIRRYGRALMYLDGARLNLPATKPRQGDS